MVYLIFGKLSITVRWLNTALKTDLSNIYAAYVSACVRVWVRACVCVCVCVCTCERARDQLQDRELREKHSYEILSTYVLSSICWFVCGRIKAKTSAIYAIKCKRAVYVVNIIQWLKKYSYFNYRLRKQSSLNILACLHIYSHQSLNELTNKFTGTIF